MRSVLMMLGVVLHSSQVFNTAQTWVIYSDNTASIAEYVVQFIATFRMPAFFIVSGYFCVLSIKKYQPKKFIKFRILRIVIPLIFTAITLNSLQVIILTYTGWHQFDLGKYLLEGGWVSHLWFLNNLILYFGIAVVLASYCKQPIQIIGKHINNLFLSVPLMAIIFTAPLMPIIIKGLNKAGFPLYYDLMGFLDIFTALIYLPYFAFGSILANNKELLHRFSTINPIVSLFLIFCSFLIMRYIPILNTNIQLAVHLYLNTLITWLSISLCFYSFYRFFNAPSEKWSFLSGASYTVYLFHHVIVIMMGLLLIRLDLAPVFNMVLLVFITMTTTLYIHKHLILKLKVARLLFNGK